MHGEGVEGLGLRDPELGMARRFAPALPPNLTRSPRFLLGQRRWYRHQVGGWLRRKVFGGMSVGTFTRRSLLFSAYGRVWV